MCRVQKFLETFIVDYPVDPPYDKLKTLNNNSSRFLWHTFRLGVICGNFTWQ